MPNSLVFLDIKNDKVTAEIQVPLQQLEIAFGKDLTSNPTILVNQYQLELRTYFLAHLKPTNIDGKPWRVNFEQISVNFTENAASGKYFEIVVKLNISPIIGQNTHQFIFDYDAVIHQVVTHVILVAVRQDLENGIVNQPMQVGTIHLEIESNKYYPLVINLSEGNFWRAFWGMVQLGMQHISEGTDHLLFLLILLIPAPLLINQRRWGVFGGTKYSLVKLLKIVTAFTVGHSITLIIGALGFVPIPSRIVEILITFTILISAINAYSPIFAGKEIYVAGGFGLIHGMAFANTLIDMSLDKTNLILSILGFNMGIEIKQILVISLIIPWLILLCQTKFYPFFRKLGAILVGISALSWLFERMSDKANFITISIEKIAQNAYFLLVGFIVFSLLSYYWFNKKSSPAKNLF